jgi:hypothetical protein
MNIRHLETRSILPYDRPKLINFELLKITIPKRPGKQLIAY